MLPDRALCCAANDQTMVLEKTEDNPTRTLPQVFGISESSLAAPSQQKLQQKIAVNSYGCRNWVLEAVILVVNITVKLAHSTIL